MVTVHHRTVSVSVDGLDDLDVFWREAGPADAPVLLLLHGSRRARTCSGT